MNRSFLEERRAVVWALLLREIRTRFGHYRLGYAWALLEPAAQVGMMLGLFALVLGRSAGEFSFGAFFVCGVTVFALFSNIVTRSLSAIEANAGLLVHRPVHPADTLVARAWLECMIHLSTFALMLAALPAIDDPFSWRAVQPLALLSAVGALLVMLLGLGLALMVLGAVSTEADKLLPVVIKPLYFVSGVFFPLDSIPDPYRHWLSWNPLTQAIEQLRLAMIDGYTSELASPVYLWTCAMVALFIGLAAFQARSPRGIAA